MKFGYIIKYWELARIVYKIHVDKTVNMHSNCFKLFYCCIVIFIEYGLRRSLFILVLALVRCTCAGHVGSLWSVKVNQNNTDRADGPSGQGHHDHHYHRNMWRGNLWVVPSRHYMRMIRAHFGGNVFGLTGVLQRLI